MPEGSVRSGTWSVQFLRSMAEAIVNIVWLRQTERACRARIRSGDMQYFDLFHFTEIM